MHKSIFFLIYGLLWFSLFGWPMTILAQQPKQSKTTAKDSVVVIEEESFIATSNIFKLLDQYVNKTQYDSIGVHIYRDSLVTLPTLFAVLDTIGVNIDSVEKIKTGLEVELEMQRRLLVVTQIGEAIDALEQAIKDKKSGKNRLRTEEAKEAMATELQTLSGRIKAMAHDYNIALTGIDTTGFFVKEIIVLPLEDEIGEIFSPIIRNIKDLTGSTRRMAKITDEITYYETHIAQIKEGVARMERVKNDIVNAEAKRRAIALLDFWQQQEKEFTTKLNTVQQQLLDEKQRRKNNPSNFITFMKGQGKNIILSLLAFMGILFFFILLHRLIKKISPFHHNNQHIFWANLIDLLLFSWAAVLAISAVLYILFLFNDWILLGIILIIILGFIWSAKSALISSGKLLLLFLNQGTVRQDERVMYKGIPYKVDRIGVFSYFVNPELSGGRIRLPIKDLLDLRSRVYADSEVWFPTSKGDRVLMDDGRFRKIIDQTPEYILITKNIGTPIPVPTAEFLLQKVENLSRSTFRIWYSFTIDYKHMPAIHEKIIPTVKAKIDEEVKKVGLGVDLESVLVEYMLDETSIKIRAGLKVPQEFAPKYRKLLRFMKHAILRLTAEEGWHLPITRVTINDKEIDMTVLED